MKFIVPVLTTVDRSPEELNNPTEPVKMCKSMSSVPEESNGVKNQDDAEERGSAA